MKKFIALFACAFVAFTFEGCAVRSFETYGDYDYEEEEEPVVKPQPKPKAKQKAQVKQKTPAKPKQNVAAPAKKKVDYEIVTDNLYPIPKALDVNNDFTVVSLTPVAYTSQDHCNEVYWGRRAGSRACIPNSRTTWRTTGANCQNSVRWR